MSLLVGRDALAARAGAARRPGSALAGLAASLGGELHAAAAHDLPIPLEKALLSRDGGRCPRHGAVLAFDPFRPHDH